MSTTKTSFEFDCLLATATEQGWLKPLSLTPRKKTHGLMYSSLDKIAESMSKIKILTVFCIQLINQHCIGYKTSIKIRTTRAENIFNSDFPEAYLFFKCSLNSIVSPYMFLHFEQINVAFHLCEFYHESSNELLD